MALKSRNKPTPKQYIRNQWFLFAILTTIIIAAVKPRFGVQGGPLYPEITAKYGAVSLIFFLSGLSLKSDNLIQTLQHRKLHLFIQGYTFVLVPLLLYMFTMLLALVGVDGWILKGMTTVACMPPPVSSAVILTRSAQGNEAAAIFNSVLGSFLGIILTPILLLLNLGYTTIVPLFSTVLQLLSTVLMPLLVGQLVRHATPFRGQGLSLTSIGQCALLFIIYTTFCDSFVSHDIGLTASDILVTIFLVVVTQVVLLSLSFWLAQNRACFTPQDVVTIVFCSTHKSLTLGIPILRIMFHGLSHMSQISLPLLVYHPTQIILGGMIVTNMKDWISHQNYRRLPI